MAGCLETIGLTKNATCIKVECTIVRRRVQLLKNVFEQQSAPLAPGQVKHCMRHTILQRTPHR
eukprot:173304-Pleurochrysis_carterae.AAC.2